MQWMGALWLGLGMQEGAAWGADKRVVTVQRLLDSDRQEDAQRKCDKWEGSSPDAPFPLREACAWSFWPEAEALGTIEGWQAYRKEWAFTTAAKAALQSEGALVLAQLDDDLTEMDLLALAKEYRNSSIEGILLQRASDVAVDRASTVEQARDVLKRYPDHPKLHELVQRFPGAFIQVETYEGVARVTIDPAITLPTRLAPAVHWVAHTSDGRLEPWDDATSSYLSDWGVPIGYVNQLPKREGRTRIPMCYGPNRPPGYGPAVGVRVGEGSLAKEADWELNCGPDATPAFITIDDDRVVGFSLMPGHVIDLRGDDAIHGNIRGEVGVSTGAPTLSNGVFYSSVGSVWVAVPASGATPWATTQGPQAPYLTMSGALQGAGLPDGWRLSLVEGGVSVTGTGAGGTDAWELVPGDIRTLSPLVQRVLGVDLTSLRSDNAAPPLGPETGWVGTGIGRGVIERPPAGGKVAGIYGMEQNAIDVAMGCVHAIGLDKSRIEVVDGWRVDLDDDRVAEAVIRGFLDGVSVVWVVDPIEGGDPSAKSRADNARVFQQKTGLHTKGGSAEAVSTPLAFRLNDHVYLAWSAHGEDSTTVTVVRPDGTGFTTVRFGL